MVDACLVASQSSGIEYSVHKRDSKFGTGHGFWAGGVVV